MTLQRKTPLARGVKPLPRSRLQAKRPEPRRRDAPRWSAAEWQDANALLMARCGGLCDCCGQPLAGRVERHHRKRRRDGGDRLSNLLALLPEHHARWTAQPAQAHERGVIVWTTEEPDTAPVLLHGRRLVLLGDDGSVTPV